MTAAPAMPRRPLALLAYGAGFILFWIYAVVPAWLREAPIPSTRSAVSVSPSEAFGWMGQTYIGRTFYVATTVHPQTTLGHTVATMFPGDYYIVDLGIDNTLGRETVSVDVKSTRMFTFSGESVGVIMPDNLSAEARALAAQSESACRDIKPGDVARTALLFFPATMDASRFCALEIVINGTRYIIEGCVLSAKMRREPEYADSLKIFELREADPVARLSRNELPKGFTPPLTLAQPK